MPWNDELIYNLMFQIKAQIGKVSSCFIPFMDRDLCGQTISLEDKQKIMQQLECGVETHLVMSNLDSIHILKIANIHNYDECKSDKVFESDDNIFKCEDKYKHWIEVDDLFVYKTNHDGSAEILEDDLFELINSEQNQNIFVPIQQLSIYASHDQDSLRAEALKWVELNRNLTYDYFIRSCELEENTYQQVWTGISKRSQHCLIMAEQLRHKAILYKDYEKLNLFKESFESYLSALINELNEVYINPLIKVYKHYDSLQEVWDGLQGGLVHPELTTILNHLFKGESAQIATLETFLIYTQHAKTFFFSMKHKYEKKIGKEEFLLMESFLAKQEILVESFLCKQLDKKINCIIEVKKWLYDIFENQQYLSLSEVKSCSLKLSYLISIMCSSSSDDNLFFQIVEQKTLKGSVRKSFEDEVRDLVKIKNKNAA